MEELWESQKNQLEMQNWVTNHHIKWHFITSLSPWRRSYYERMVGLVKRTLQKTIGQRILMLEEYQTFLCEAEGIINMRPLTYIK